MFPHVAEPQMNLNGDCVGATPGGERIRADKDFLLRADGTVKCLHWEVDPWYTSAGGIGGFVIFTEDITERKQSEEALHNREAQLRAILDTASDAIVTFNHLGYYSIGQPRHGEAIWLLKRRIIGPRSVPTLAGAGFQEARFLPEPLSRDGSRRQQRHRPRGIGPTQ